MTVIQDSSGFQIFSDSDIGSAHVTAHRMLDLGQLDRGHALLGEWLDGRTGRGSEWVHIQWHMLVFELAVGEWESARARFETYVLPVARESDQAVTDAPSGLWRIALHSPSPMALPWDDVARRARERLSQERDPYSELHDLLALAGAGDAGRIYDWMDERRWYRERNPTLLRFAHAFGALANGKLLSAAAHFERALPELPTLGGSRAQNELFYEIHELTLDAVEAPQAA